MLYNNSWQINDVIVFCAACRVIHLVLLACAIIIMYIMMIMDIHIHNHKNRLV